MSLTYPPKTHTLNKNATFRMLTELYESHDIYPDLDQQDHLADWLLSHLVNEDLEQKNPIPFEMLETFPNTWIGLLPRLHHVFMNVFEREHALICHLRERWLGVACAKPVLAIKQDTIEIQFIMQPYLNIDQFIHEEIVKAQNAGLHIPYRYLRAIGRC